MNKSDHTQPVVSESNKTADRPRVGFSFRHCFAILAVALFCAFEVVVYRVELAMFHRFISRSLVSLVFVLTFFIWWAFNRQLCRRARLGAICILAIGATIAAQFADKSFNAWSILFMFLPFVAIGWMAWSVIARNRSQRTQLIGCTAIVLAVGVYYCTLRMDGINGVQQPEMAWRWNPTKEDLFLASIAKDKATSAAEDAAEPPSTSKSCELQPGDWAEFRGQSRDSVVSGVTLAGTFEESPPELVWRKQVGPGWSSMIVVDGRLVTQEQRGDAEAVVCYDAATGDQTWIHEDNARFYESLAGAGPRATPTFHEGRVYAIGGTGLLNCLDASTGKKLWSRDTAAEASSKPPMWGFSASPLVVNNTVLAYAAGEEKCWLAYREADGEFLWSAPGGSQSYSSAELVTLDGLQQILMHDNKSLKAINIADGKPLWTHACKTEHELPMLQPWAIDDHRLLIQSDNGIAMLEIKRENENWSINEVWTSKGLKPSFNDFVVCDDRIYGLDDGILACLDLATGERVWKKGRYGHGQMLLLKEQKQMVVLSEQGEIILVAADPTGLRELGRMQAITGKTWNHPVVAHGNLYVRNGEEMACLKLRITDPNIDPLAFHNPRAYRRDSCEQPTNQLPIPYFLSSVESISR